MQLSFSTTLLLLPLLTSAHMMLEHPSVWGRKTQKSSLETPLNSKTGANWLHHGAKKDTDEVMTLTAGQAESLPIICGEALGKAGEAGQLCKAKSGTYRHKKITSDR